TSRRGFGAALGWWEPDLPVAQSATDAGCDNIDRMAGPSNPTKLVLLCPVSGYVTGGAGFIENLMADRIGTRVAGTNFVRSLGHHQFMYGWDFEDNRFEDTRFYSGGGSVTVSETAGGIKYVSHRSFGYFKDNSMPPRPENVELRPPAQYLSQCHNPQ